MHESRWSIATSWRSGSGPSARTSICCGHVHAAWAYQPDEIPDQLCLNPGAPLLRDTTGRRPPGFLEITLERRRRQRSITMRWTGECLGRSSCSCRQPTSSPRRCARESIDRPRAEVTLLAEVAGRNSGQTGQLEGSPYSTHALCLATRIMPARAGDGLLVVGEFELGDDALRVERLELLGGGRGVELLGRDGPIGQDRDDVVADLDEAAVDEVAADDIAGLGPQLAKAEPADQRGAARQDTQLAVVERQGDEVDPFVEQGLLRA